MPVTASKKPSAADVSAWTRNVMLPMVITRGVLVVAALLSVLVLPVSRWVPGLWTVPGANRLADAFSRWDAVIYVRIAGHGYTTSNTPDAAFFPLFPAIMHVVGSVTGLTSPDSLEVVGILVANLALVVTLAGLAALARLDFDAVTATRAAWALLAFPTSIFLSAGYPESLFLALSIWAYLACRRDRWLLAGVLGAGAALTRPFGFLVALILAAEAVVGWRQGARTWRPIIAVILVAVSPALYLVFLARQYGDALAFLHAAAGWEKRLTLPWDTFARFFSGPITIHSGEHALVDLAFTILLITLVALSWRVLRPALALYATALLGVLLSTGSLVSMPRYALAEFPIFLVLAIAARRDWFERGYLVVGVSLGAVFMVLFAQWYWVS